MTGERTQFVGLTLVQGHHTAAAYASFDGNPITLAQDAPVRDEEGNVIGRITHVSMEANEVMVIGQLDEGYNLGGLGPVSIAPPRSNGLAMTAAGLRTFADAMGYMDAVEVSPPDRLLAEALDAQITADDATIAAVRRAVRGDES